MSENTTGTTAALRAAPPVEEREFTPRYALPRIVIRLANLHEAWVCGSAADPAKNPATVRDIDIIVPFSHWQAAALLIPPDAKPNMFGGWKFESDGRSIDLWPGDLAWLMVNFKARWAWQIRYGIRIQKTFDAP